MLDFQRVFVSCGDILEFRGMDCVDLAQDGYSWRVLVNAVMKLSVSLNAGNFLFSRGPSFSGRTAPRSQKRLLVAEQPRHKLCEGPPPVCLPLVVRGIFRTRGLCLLRLPKWHSVFFDSSGSCVLGVDGLLEC